MQVTTEKYPVSFIKKQIFWKIKIKIGVVMTKEISHELLVK